MLIFEVLPGVRDIPRAMESSPIRPTVGSIQHAECSVRAGMNYEVGREGTPLSPL